MKYFHLLPLILLLFLFTACSSVTATQPASSPTPVQNPTQGTTPIPTVPTVSSHLVHFMTSDHVKLAGLLYGYGKTAVICSHELHTSKIIWDESAIVPILATRGYLVLAYDFRGNGDSTGQNDTSKLAVDLQAAVAFVRQQGATRIVLMGASMGGTATLKVAASVPVAAVVTLSAPQNFGGNMSDATVRSIKAPKLFVNSKQDGFAGDTNHMYAVAIQPKEILLYDGSAHGTSLFDSGADGRDLTQRIQNFIEHYAPAGS